MAGQGSLINKSCACCKRYMDHMDGKMKCFLRNMTVNFRQGLSIPDRFMKHFVGEISETIELESPNGNVYEVKIARHMNKTVQCGWEAFVDAHRIKENDSLLFQHIENCRFGVLILDADGCEKVFSCSSKNISSSAKERGVESVDISDSSDDGTQKSQGVRKRFASFERGSPSSRRKTARMVATSSSFSSSSEESGEDTEGPSVMDSSFELDDIEEHAEPDYILSQRCKPSEEQEEKVAKFVQEIQSEITLFVAIMRQSNVKLQSPTLVIPKHYAAVHFPHKSQTVTLLRPGKNKKWHPKFYVRKDRSAYMFLGHWVDFVRDNHVREGDICIFEPMKNDGRKFTVTVYRLRESNGYLLGGDGNVAKGVISRDGRTRMEVNGPKRESSSEGRPRATTPFTTCVKEEPVNGCNHGHRAHQRRIESDDSGEPSKPHYILSGHANLTREQKRRVEERVLSLQSEVPIYVAIMNKSSVGNNKNCVLIFVKRYATEYLPNGEHTMMLVRTRKSKTWKVKMVPRSGDAQMLTGGWHDFVNDNRLKVEDICLFELMKDEMRLTMTVHIIRHDEHC
ncbi:hypothetical protein ACP70R_025012 [Stipagrostis hirtigluma subsp. patula]